MRIIVASALVTCLLAAAIAPAASALKIKTFWDQQDGTQY